MKVRFLSKEKFHTAQINRTGILSLAFGNYAVESRIATTADIRTFKQYIWDEFAML
jgi:hypothetical protein